MNRFAAIKTERTPPAPQVSVEEGSRPPSGKTPGRVGKKVVGGYFSLEFSRALHMLALEQDTSLQALLGEAVDDLMRKYGRHPFGER